MDSIESWRVGNGDTYAVLQRRQLEQVAELKRANKQKAATVLDEFAKRHDWPQEDVNEVAAALGLQDAQAS